MTAPVTTCPGCQRELREPSPFCPSCGAKTPHSVDSVTGEYKTPVASDGEHESAHRDRLQRALGGAWQIVRLLGRGGFAEVYVAWDVQLRREVAVKTLRHDLEVSSAMLQRFRREAESVARLRHPNIVPIYQVGEGEGLVYFMMPLIEGESLAAPLVRGEQFSVAETSRILREAASALGAAHRTGVIHRDIKPDNIMLEGPERRAVVMDFGIAKLADSIDAGLTGTGLLIGTPQYMSPEQAAGERQLDARSDQYSLAVVGYQMLAGHMPFQAASVQAILFKQMTESPPSIADVRPDIPEAMAAALDRALSKDPAARFASMEEFTAALAAADAIAQGAAGSLRRRIEPRARTKMALETIARWRVPAIAASIVMLIAFLALYTVVVQKPALDIAANRDDAVFAGRSFLASIGVPKNVRQRSNFFYDDSLYRFLQRPGRAFAAVDSEAASVGVWGWRVSQFDPRAHRPWKANVVGDGHVLEYGSVFLDTAAGASLSDDSARAIGERALAKHGLKLESLRFASDSVIRRANRTDHVLRWAPPADSIVGRDGVGLRRVELLVAGDQAAMYRERVLLPRTKQVRSDGVKLAAQTLITIAGIGLFVFAVVLVVRRSRRDDLRWGAMLRVCAVALIAICVEQTVRQYYEIQMPATGVSRESVFSGIMSVVFVTTLMLGIFLAVAVAGESLASESRPEMVAGLEDVANGRVLVPEVATGALIGYATGLCILAGMTLAILLAAQFAGVPRPGALDETYSPSFPAMSPILVLASAVMLLLPLLYALALGAWRRIPVALILTVPAILFGAAGIAFDSTPFNIAVHVAMTLVITFVVWRQGVLAGLIAIYVVSVVPATYVLLATGQILAGILGLACFAAPAVFGVLAHRRLRTVSALPRATPVTA